MCSVRQRPIPSAPNSRALAASWGVSALVRTFRVRVRAAHSMSVAKSPEIVVGQDTLPHGDDPLVAEEHVLGAAQADPLGAELARLGGVLGGVGVGADLQGAGPGGPLHERGEVARDRRRPGYSSAWR